MFRITQGKGFQIEFPNGYTVSVQWGIGNYCEHYGVRVGYKDCETKNRELGEQGCKTAEVGWWKGHNQKDMLVEGYCTPERVATIIVACALGTMSLKESNDE